MSSPSKSTFLQQIGIREFKLKEHVHLGLWISANIVRNINTARKLLLADENYSHDWNQVVVWLYIYLYVYI